MAEQLELKLGVDTKPAEKSVRTVGDLILSLNKGFKDLQKSYKSGFLTTQMKEIVTTQKQYDRAVNDANKKIEIRNKLLAKQKALEDKINAKASKKYGLENSKYKSGQDTEGMYYRDLNGELKEMNDDATKAFVNNPFFQTKTGALALKNYKDLDKQLVYLQEDQEKLNQLANMYKEYEDADVEGQLAYYRKKEYSYKKQIAEYQQMMNKTLSDYGVDPNSAAGQEILSTYNKEIDDLTKKILEAKAAFQQLFNATYGSAKYQGLKTEVLGGGSVTDKRLIGANQRIENRMASINERKNTILLRVEVSNKQEIEKLEADLEKLKNDKTTVDINVANANADLENANQNVMNLNKNLDEVKTKDVIKNMLTDIGKGISKAFEKGEKVVSKFAKSLKGLTKPLRSLEKDIHRATRGFGRFSRLFTMMIARKAFTALIKDYKSGFDALIKYSDGLNSSFSQLYSAIKTLTYTIVSAFGPVIQWISPIIAGLANAVSRLLNVIGKFNAYLFTNSKTYDQAKQQNLDYAESLDEVGGSAKKANKQLAAFDTINKLESNDSGSGGGGADALNPSDIFETVPVEQPIIDFVDKLKDGFKNGDLTEVGEIIGKKLNEQVQKAFDFATNPETIKAVHNSASAVATLFNGFFENNDGNLLGSTIGAWINLGLEASKTWVTTFDFVGFGTWLGDLIVGAFTGIDWNALGYTLGGFIRGTIATAVAALQEMSFEDITTAIKDFFSGFWSGLWGETSGETPEITAKINSVEKALLGVVAAIATLKASLAIFNGVMNVINLFSKLGSAIGATGTTMELAGAGFTAMGTSIKGAVMGILTAIGTVVTAILGAMGIVVTLPAWVVGLITAGVVALIAIIVKYWDEICAFFVSAWDWLKNFFAELPYKMGEWIGSLARMWWDFNTVTLPNLWKSIWEWITVTLPNLLVNFFTKTLPDLFWKAVDWFKDLPAKFKEWAFDTINGFINGIKEKIGAVKQAIGDFVQGIKDGFCGKGDEDGGGLDINSPSKVFKKFGNYIVEGLNLGLKESNVDLSFFDKLNALGGENSTVTTTLLQQWEYFAQQLTIIFQSISDMIKTQLVTFVQMTNATMTTVQNGLNRMVSALNDVIEDYNRAAAETGGRRISYVGSVRLENIPIPKLATGGVIPKSNPFLAVLGDNKKETEIVSPLSTMKQAFLDAMNESNYSNSRELILEVDGRELGRAVINLGDLDRRRIGTKFVM